MSKFIEVGVEVFIIVAGILAWKEYKKNKAKKEIFYFSGLLLFSLLHFQFFLLAVSWVFFLIGFAFSWISRFMAAGLRCLHPIYDKTALFLETPNIHHSFKLFVVRIILNSITLFLMLTGLILEIKKHIKDKKR
jgi:hypothetical protein